MFIAIRSKEDCAEALEAARRYSPNIEIVDQTTLVFDLTGSKTQESPRVAAELREKFEAVAMSENLAEALLLARWAREEGPSSRFQVSGSKFREREDRSAGERESAGEVPNPKFQVPGSGEQIRNPEPNSPNSANPANSVNSVELFKVRNSEYMDHGQITNGTEFNERAFGARNKGRANKKFRVPSSKFQVRTSEGKREKEKGKTGVRDCGSAGKEFKVQSSKFKVCDTDEGKRQKAKGKRENSVNSVNSANCLSTQHSVLSTELSALPITAVSDSREFLELMDAWAIHDLGSFAALPEDGMVARFGQEIVELRRQAAGEAFRAPNWNVKDDKFFWAKDLEGVIETLEPLNFVLSAGVAQIFRNLDYVGLSTQSSKITIRGRKKEKAYKVRLVFPTKNQKIWIRQIVTRIELDPPEFNIDRVEIVFRSAKPRTVQNNLYSGTILEPENLNLIVSKLKKVVGLKKIGVPRLRDAWRKRFYMTEDLSALIAERKFRVPSSEFQVRDTDEGKRQKEKGKTGVRESGSEGKEFKVQSSRFNVQDSNSEPGTRNSELGTWNSELSSTQNLTDQFKVQSSKFKVRDVDTKPEESKPNKQTRNQKLETRNSPTPHPQSLVPVFFYFPRPVRARVFFEGGEPKAILIRGKREMVRTSGGPWRKDAEWYELKKWQRDEWDIETESGAVYKIYIDKNGDAFVEGGYD